jgi:adenylate kinase
MEARNVRAPWLDGKTPPCEITAEHRASAIRLVLLGAPGVGKGTQADLLHKQFGSCNLSTGDVFRAARTAAPCDRTPAMTEAIEYMRRGELVPDETVLAVVRERRNCLHCPGGFLLDGFPRTVPQAEAMQEMLEAEHVKLDAVVSYELPIDRIVVRLSGRRVCSECKAVFHVETLPPKTQGVCDHCGGTLVQREDDQPESIRVRMEAYETATKPLVDYFRERGLLVPISGEGTPQEIFQRTLAALEKRN